MRTMVEGARPGEVESEMAGSSPAMTCESGGGLAAPYSLAVAAATARRAMTPMRWAR